MWEAVPVFGSMFLVQLVAVLVCVCSLLLEIPDSRGICVLAGNREVGILMYMCRLYACMYSVCVFDHGPGVISNTNGCAD